MKSESDRNDLLYHYTSINSLLKILDISESDKMICLWATHAKYFNDPYEYKISNFFIKKIDVIDMR